MAEWLAGCWREGLHFREPDWPYTDWAALLWEKHLATHLSPGVFFPFRAVTVEGQLLVYGDASYSTIFGLLP